MIASQQILTPRYEVVRWVSSLGLGFFITPAQPQKIISSYLQPQGWNPQELKSGHARPQGWNPQEFVYSLSAF